MINPRQDSIQIPFSNDDQWYVLKNERKYGPVKFGDLAKFAKQKLLLEEDWVWRNGLDQWIAAKDVSGLFETPVQARGKPTQINLAGGKECGDQEHTRTLKERAIDSVKSFLQIFLYLWLVFGLLAIHQSIILSEYKIDYQAHGFAVINALVFAKVMLIAEELRLGDRFDDKPLIYPILFKSLFFAITLICFHIAEHALVGMWHGQNVAESFSDIGVNKLRGIVSFSVIATVALMPFFALRGISRLIGRGNFWSLFFRRKNS